MLVADSAHEERLAMIGGGLHGIQNAEAGARRVGEVKQEAAGEGIACVRLTWKRERSLAVNPLVRFCPLGSP